MIYNNVINITGTSSANGIFCNYPNNHQYNVTIIYNSIYRDNAVGIPLNMNLNTGYVHNFIVANNIFVIGGTAESAIRGLFYSTDANLLRVNNLYYHMNGSKVVKTSFPDGSYQFEATSIRANPMFEDIGSGDLHLTSASPCIGAANEAYTVLIDYDSNPRPEYGSYDIGAYEYYETDSDTTPPIISNIQMYTLAPLDVVIGWENITCIVTDNVAIGDVVLSVTDSEYIVTNHPMNQKSGSSIYYCNITLVKPSNYLYHVWADDTNNNLAISTTLMFSLPPNWDINGNGICTILDQVFISNHYGETGAFGWIREDVDNNGVINVLDIILASNHHGESW
jgi:hypothetical protein